MVFDRYLTISLHPTNYIFAQEPTVPDPKFTLEKPIDQFMILL
jgi:hypothetical protein